MKYIKLFFVSVLLVSLHSNCSDLDYTEASNYKREYIFSDFGRSSAFLSNIYSYLPTDFNKIDGAMRSSASDDAEHVWDLSRIQKFNDGSWSALQTIDDQWGNMYSGIRAVNLFLEETKGRTFDDLRYNDGYDLMIEQFEMYPYEARFLRAFFYFELIKRYGDVPLITSVLTADRANNVMRSSFDSVVDFIVSECDDISAQLPLSFADMPGSQTGRTTKGAALALKARALLYAASPLHNQEGDQSKWTAAATAAKAVIDAGTYTLDASYSNVVNNLASSELILETRQPASNEFERANFPVGFEGGNTGTMPTQNLVDTYEMQETGKGIHETGSGYDPSNPYVGRDPRLSATVFYNGSMLHGQPVEIWYGGVSAPPTRYATKTGYYLNKYLIQSISLDPTNPSSKEHVWVLFRYAEVLLNYAEAMNEALGPYATGPNELTMTAAEAVNLVRARAGMPDFPTGLTQDAFRDKLRNERRVELAFEDHRFWDIRRWKIGPSTTSIYGVDITKNSTGELSYTIKLVEERVWDDKMYFYPIPQSELYVNKALTPNPGW